MKISIIVAVAENGVIGANNSLLWKLSTDLKLFKSLTISHHILMGRKTFDSIGKALPNRINIVITKNESFKVDEVFAFDSIQKGIDFAMERNETELFIIGGGKIYQQVLPIADSIYLTKVHTIINGDTYFPNLKSDEWKVIKTDSYQKDEKNEYDFDFQILKKQRRTDSIIE